MRTWTALLVLAGLAGCAHGTGRLAVSDDGRAAIVGGQSWRTPDGVTLAARGDGLHVVSAIPGAAFDVAVSFDDEGRPVVPATAPFEVRDGVIVVRGRALATTASLVESGQLYPHDEHFHLTHRWDNADWRALYRAREEGSGLPGATRQAAAYALATLLDRRIPGASEEASAEGLRRMAETVARARRAVEGQAPSKQIMAVVVHDLEILDGGAAVTVEGQLFKAGPGVRFASCGDHFHVEDAGGAWAHVVPLAELPHGQFEMPTSMFFEVSGGTVSPRGGDAVWKALLARGEIKLGGDRWYVTERYGHPAYQRLQRAALDEAAPPAVRDGARATVIEFLKAPLDISSDAAFDARLAAIDAAIDARWHEVEAQLPAKRR
jgi:hypothetical protein